MAYPEVAKVILPAGLRTKSMLLILTATGKEKKNIAALTYTEKEKLAVYERMLLKTKELIKQHQSVVLDATFYKDDIREKFTGQLNADIHFIEIKTSEALRKERLSLPRMDSDADFGIYQKIATQWEPMKEDHLVLFSTQHNIEDMLARTLEYLGLKNDKSAN